MNDEQAMLSAIATHHREDTPRAEDYELDWTA